MIIFEFLRNVTVIAMCFVGPSNLSTGNIYCYSRFTHIIILILTKGVKLVIVLVDSGEQVLVVLISKAQPKQADPFSN